MVTSLPLVGVGRHSPEDRPIRRSTSQTPALRVVIPARNEAGAIARALEALGRQVDLDGRPLVAGCFAVLVLANNCDDDTAAVARNWAADHPRLPVEIGERRFAADQAHIGTARRTLFDWAGALFRTDGFDGIVASTDADTTVEPTWVAATMAEFAAGAEAVGGRIVLREPERASMDPDLRLLHLRDTGYRMLLAHLEGLVDPLPWDPIPRHHQHFGASLAVRMSVYQRAGGIPPVSALEDMALAGQLRRIDARLRHSPRVRVTTSARRDGRVAMGLSTQLQEWAMAATAGVPRVEEPAARSLRRMELVRDRRALWQRHGPIDGYPTCGAWLDAISGEIESAVQQAVPYEPHPIERVIQDLRVEIGRRAKRSSR